MGDFWAIWGAIFWDFKNKLSLVVELQPVQRGYIVETVLVYKILWAIFEVILGPIFWDFKNKPPSVLELQPVLLRDCIVEKVLVYKLL